MLKEAKIDCTIGMMANIMNGDDDTIKLKVFPKFGEIFQPFEQNIEESTAKYQSDMKIKHKEKVNTLAFCE